MNQKKHENIVMDSNLAELLGAFIGDGWIEQSRKGFYITGHLLEDKEYYDSFLGPLFSKYFHEVKPREFFYWHVYGISCYKKEVIEKCIALGFQTGLKALTAKMPQTVLDCSDLGVIKAILRGIFDTDGCFGCGKSRAKTSVEWKRTYHYIPQITITSCSRILLTQSLTLLDKLSIRAKIRPKNIKGFRSNRNVNNSYVLEVRRFNDVQKWFDIIGTNNPRHQTRYLVWRRYGFLPPRTNITQRKAILAGELDPYSFYIK